MGEVEFKKNRQDSDVHIDYGDFIVIKDLRIRKDLVMYYWPQLKEEDGKKVYLLFLTFMGALSPNFNVAFDSEEDLINAVVRLDGIYKTGHWSSAI